MDLRKYHNELFEYLRVKSSQKRCSADMHFLLEALQEKALQECHDRVFEAVDIANNDWGFSKGTSGKAVLLDRFSVDDDFIITKSEKFRFVRS